jgi:hypothetical protein
MTCTSREKLTAATYAGALLWINLYICRDLFWNSTAFTNSMHGFWAALGRLGDGWFRSTWWPYWDCGLPFEFTYQPLVPFLTQLVAAWRGVPHLVAFQTVSAAIYCLLPLTLFLMAWILTRAPGRSFAAALFFTLVAPTEMIVPDGPFRWAGLWNARRVFVQMVWDEAPHYAGLVFLPLIILFLAFSIQKRRAVWYAAAAISIGLGALASDFCVIETAIAALCLLTVLKRESWRSNIAIVAGIGIFAYALASPFLSPSLIQVIHENSEVHEGSLGYVRSSMACAITALGWVVLWYYLARWTKDWRLQFFTLLAYVMSCVPLLFIWLSRTLLPQAFRYKIEMEVALALPIAFGTAAALEKLPRSIRIAVVFLLVTVAAQQVVSHRQFAKNVLAPQDVTKTIEYRTAQWASRNLPGVRIMLPGSVAQWANASSDVMQFAGSSWSVASNQTQQRGLRAIWNGGETEERDRRVSLAWLKAYGVGAVAISGPQSQEFWKVYAHPKKFEGALPAIWKEDDMTIYRLPQRSPSLAHVVPESALVRRAPRQEGDIDGLERYDRALEDAALPEASFQWEGRNRIHIRTAAAPGQAISVQVSYHPGWHATINGSRAEVHRDGLGLAWLKPTSSGPCNVDLVYDGGWELRLCRWASLASMMVLGLALVVRRSSRGGKNTRPSPREELAVSSFRGEDPGRPVLR